jgi:hypothetical protein
VASAKVINNNTIIRNNVAIIVMKISIFENNENMAIMKASNMKVKSDNV